MVTDYLPFPAGLDLDRIVTEGFAQRDGGTRGRVFLVDMVSFDNAGPEFGPEYPGNLPQQI